MHLLYMLKWYNTEFSVYCEQACQQVENTSEDFFFA